MAVVNIRRVSVRVRDRLVPVRVRVRFTRGVLRRVIMLMMIVMNVNVLMLQNGVRVMMFVPRTQEDGNTHQHCGKREQVYGPRPLTEDWDRRKSTHERCGSEEDCFTRRADVA